MINKRNTNSFSFPLGPFDVMGDFTAILSPASRRAQYSRAEPFTSGFMIYPREYLAVFGLKTCC